METSTDKGVRQYGSALIVVLADHIERREALGDTQLYYEFDHFSKKTEPNLYQALVELKLRDIMPPE
jgi:hypothetical protein